MELHISGEDGIRKYDINSPYYAMLDLRTRFKVFLNRKALVQGRDYSINIYRGFIKFEDHIMIGLRDDIDIICFYTGTKYNKAIPELPMSGYIYFNKYEIDRNLNKNLIAVFVNGKLVQRKDILDISNNIHKVSRDIKSRYNLEVLNLSPRVDSLVPRFKRPISRGVVKKKIVKWINGRIGNYEIGKFQKDLFEGPNGSGIKVFLDATAIDSLYITGKNTKMFKEDFSMWLFDRGNGITLNYLPKYKVTITQSPHQTITVHYNGKEYSGNEVWVVHGEDITVSIRPDEGYNPGTLNITSATITGPTEINATPAAAKEIATALIPWNAGRFTDFDTNENKYWKVKEITIPDGIDRVLVMYSWHYRSDEVWDQGEGRQGYESYKQDRSPLDDDIRNDRLPGRWRSNRDGDRYRTQCRGTAIFNYNNLVSWFDTSKSVWRNSAWRLPDAVNRYGADLCTVVGVTPGKTYKLCCFSYSFKSRPYGYFIIYNETIKNLPINITDY